MGKTTIKRPKQTKNIEVIGARVHNLKNVNVKIGWRNDSWEVAYSVENATDETTVRLALNPSPVSGVNGFTMFNPKLSTFSVKYNF